MNNKDSIIELIDDTSARVKAGEVETLLHITLDTDGTMAHTYEGKPDILRLLGAMVVCAFDLVHDEMKDVGK